MKGIAIGILAAIVGMAAVSAPVKSNVAGNEVGRNGAPLPYDAEVEYLESTGTQWIDTGWVVTQTTKMCLDIFIVRNSGNFGCIDAADARCHSDSAAGLFRIGNTLNAYNFTVDARVNVIADIQNLVYTINGISTPMQRPDNLPISTFGLFARNFNGAWSPCRMTVYAIQFYSNGVLVRDMIPVRFTNEQGQREGAMYDRVSGELFRNQGAGAFIIGPDKR